jgi:hypothetical protein
MEPRNARLQIRGTNHLPRPLVVSRFLSLLLCGLFAGCSAAKFDTANSNVSGLADQDGTPIVCDPFEPANVVSSISGLKGTIHSWPISNKSKPSSSLDLIRLGYKIDADLFLNKVDVPTRMFDSGFTSSDGKALVNEDDELLTEWFALDVKSKLKLAPGEPEGLYQLAILSDDGSTLFLTEQGLESTLISNEGAHQTKLGCAPKAISMSKDLRLPMRLTYFEGPRYHIALTLMWRKVDSHSGSLAEKECRAEGNEYFFTPATNTTVAVPKAPYLGMLDRGWRPLKAENFELSSGYNLCSK